MRVCLLRLVADAKRMFACFCWKRMPHRRRANEVSLCYLQSGGTCTGRSKLESLRRQEDSLEPAPAGVNLRACAGRKILWNLHRQDERWIKPNLILKPKFDFAFWNERENLIGILIMPSENFWPEFFQRTFSLLRFLDQLLGFISRLVDFIESKFDFSFEIK